MFIYLNYLKQHMNWREVLNPNKEKIAIFVVTSLILMIIPIVPHLQYPQCEEGAPCPSYFMVVSFASIIYYGYLVSVPIFTPTFKMHIYEVLLIPVVLAIAYLIACFVVHKTNPKKS